jgi:glycosyltransferase involved in cell wall biosynthesis
MRATVIICTHNPGDAYLRRTLAGLQAQTLPVSDWELILIDNASSIPLAHRFNLSWHPYGRLVHESKLGLTSARCRGIGEARGEVLVFVDDDNVLCESYLKEALSISDKYPFLGAWGAGLIAPIYEVPPPDWAGPYLGHLSLRDIRQKRWSNGNDYSATPVGAGLCIRRFIAEKYRQEISGDPLRAQFDRKGTNLDCAGDVDLAYTSARFALGWGVFPELKIHHLIPPARTTKKYLLNIQQASAASLVLLTYKLGEPLPPRQSTLKRALRALWIFWSQGWIQAKLFIAHHRGIDDGYSRIAKVVET